MPKNIVLCLDGTHNSVAGTNTNVWRLYAALERSPAQATFYNPGVGTLLDPAALTWARRMFLKGLDLATASSLPANVARAYAFLMRAYEPGDRVFLFGFSRGAYAARAVAGAVHAFGLLRPEDEHLLPYLWQTYSDDLARPDPSGASPLFATAAKFRTVLSRPEPVPIALLGVWDTVSAYGVISRFRTLPYTRANPSVATVRHAVSLDERRSAFRLNRFDHAVERQDLRQVWFAGYHSDVGGGIAPPENELGRPSLGWMAREARAAGVLLDPARLDPADPDADALAPAHDSMDPLYRLQELLPTRRWNPERGGYALERPNLFRPRVVPEGALLHASVERRLKAGAYRPRNLPKTYAVEPD